MYKKFVAMSFKEFSDYCNKRACDGLWSMSEAMWCIDTFEYVNSYKVKGLFGLTSKKKTEILQEEKWREITNKL